MAIVPFWNEEGKAFSVRKRYPTLSLEYDFVVDLSNVCRDRVLGAPEKGASLDAVRRIEGALARVSGGNSPHMFYIADNSLWDLLERAHGKANVADWKLRHRRQLLQIHYADQSILQFAESTGCAVVSLDKFSDWRKTHDWIQGSTNRFVGWSKDRGGEVRAYFRSMSVLADDEASRREEDRSFRDSGFDTKSREHEAVLGRMYRCDNSQCELHRLNPYFLIGPPRRDRKRDCLVCHACHAEVTDVGEVGRVTQLKVELPESGSAGRFTIYQGQGTKVGRNTLHASLDNPCPADRESLQRVSREHITFRAEGPILMAADLGSTNGTTLEQFDRSSRSLSEPVKLERHQAVQLNPNDVLTLAGVVRIRKSGNRFRFDGLTTGEPEDGPGPGDTAAA